jgi:DNA/RNA-binding domain of Phe-tRNA-synthetase-like protein
MREAANPDHHEALEKKKTALENELRARYAGYDRAALKSTSPVDAYTSYYKRFKKTYHVLLQLESVVQKGKSIPRVAALVEAMFMAELDNLLLTAGHDLDKIDLPVTIDVAGGGENYTNLTGKPQTLKPDDMMMKDGSGVICSVIYGSDDRTIITSSTRQVMFVVYAPPGIGEMAVQKHLNDIRENVTLIAPQAEVQSLETFAAG